MSESALRWLGRLSRLKVWGLLAGIGGILLLVAAVTTLSVARQNNPNEPYVVDVGQLARGEISTSRYVSVSGLTTYDIFYTETEDGNTKARYYFVVDEALANIVLVEAAGVPEVKSDLEPITLTGMTRSMQSGLKDLVKSDLPDYQEAGLAINTDLYVAEGDKPPTVGSATTFLVIGLVLLVFAGVTLVAPGTVFGPAPVDTTAVAPAGDPGVRASGTFQQLKTVNPLEIGRRTQKFNSAIANLVPLQDRRLLVYIHHVVTTRTYGIKISQSETHWGIFVGHDNVVGIEPGKLYGWKSQPAVRLRYRDDKGKERDAIVSFNHSGAQSGFVNLLKQLGFTVGSGMPAAL